MKKIFIIIPFLILIGFLGFKLFKNDDVSPEALEMVTSYLASEELEGRELGSVGIEKAAIYIEAVFEKNNIKPYFETYRNNFKWSAIDAYNIVGYIEGSDPKLKNEVVIIGAHYDHIGIVEKVGDDNLANGANDNASGVSGVLLIAQHFAAKKSNKRSILVALFSAEEKGMLGSAHLAKTLKEDNIDPYIMLNFEMIGVPFPDRDYMAFITGHGLSNMSEKINEYSDYNLTGLSEISKERDLFIRSDNYPFYEAFKIPSQTISCSDLSNFDYYHHVDDEADKLDYEHMADLINKTIPAIEAICNTPTKEIKLYNE
ncbi:M20/M25/M40 family metallo-hydrolase [Confluentibacter flavum]|uniref:Peptidase M28 n=1 Tax=Confluentibacter flavum TaxID=1909700 RepID=A0A2N3HIS6_9FLAO|nr:M20/M25/M40 family metallo-hydrolase [Confluentibacter flavum]PKQ44803.1 peptidase M28 [Confluentibacter flavum]